MLITAGTKINAYFLQRKVKKPIIFYFFFFGHAHGQNAHRARDRTQVIAVTMLDP